ncbi:anaerobic carbon-monoxide dehydrogenase catalytic subunit [Desulfomonile tiedjei]|uniref:anaerobic carbon-monoxide dehydrogenase n=1 Tax=Desulfomonile tiedjei (strain ATCC 49306 / DSM 6799 / DCB-1) TaxID=706587 RepID=I4C087_DESTA|nr:anaerobic carbon-monoxide dehydrogenase catalytic subunit [Desulfomonile tiedjei]AFM22978.1 acetyl-CoA decarbonylase/synthase delta subunit [Desulfomonile tiedjei DSM 6799]
MAELPKVKYSGKIREIKIGKPGCEITVGGETAYNFYSFEGKTPNAPKLALQVLDIVPEEWAAEALAPFKDVLGDPVAWAKKCVDEYKADAVCLWLTGTDPNGKNLSAEHAAKVAKEVAEAINVPLIVWGTSSDVKNTEVLKAVAEACAGLNVVIGPVTEGNYKQVGAAAIAYKHTVAANTPIDINLAKQLNILLENLGVPNDKILVDPTTGGVGYGMEYCYSIMERIRQAALTQNDDKLQYPIINNVAEEVWKTKEAKLSTDADPKLGEAGTRGINLEAITALSALQAGSDLLILRHPKTLEHIRKYISSIMVETTLDAMGVDLKLIEAAAPKAEPAAAKPAAAAPKPAEKPAPAPAPPKAAEPKEEKAPPVTKPAAPKAAAKPAVEEEEAIMGLTKDDVQGLKEMVGFFKALKTAMGADAPVAKAEGPAVVAPPPKKKEVGPADWTQYAIDTPTIEGLKKADREGYTTAFHRARTMTACPIGKGGTCCKICNMGPCRVLPPKGKDETPEERKKRTGLCGATPETIAARNFARMVAAGAAAHSDHGRHVAHTFLHAAKGELPDYQIKDIPKLFAIAMDYDIPTEGREIKDIAIDVGKRALQQYGQQDGEILNVKRAPLKRQEIWKQEGVIPAGIDRPVVEVMHMTHMGVNQEMEHIIRLATKCSLADGWGGSMIATDLSDILYGTPVPILGKVNLGCMKEDTVNIIVHGHEPSLSEIIVQAVQDPEMIAYAKSKGATGGISLGGICCTSNEILMRHGIPVAGNYLQQEIAVITGALEAIVVDVQCVMQGLAELAKCFHTQVVTTSPIAKMQGAYKHYSYDERYGLETAKAIVKDAIDNFPNRDKNKVSIPTEQQDMVVGFSHETISYMLGGMFRASYRPLNDNIINGRVRGLAGIVGCGNARVKNDYLHVELAKELIKNDVLVLTTGCSAIALGKAGLLTPEASKYCGAGLAEVCETVGIPPCLHMGSCVDNSRILMAATAVVRDGGLGDDISDLPAVGCAPEWMSEKAVSIGQYFVASGVYVLFGVGFPTINEDVCTNYLFKDIEKTYGGRWDFVEKDPYEMAKRIIAQIDAKRKALGIDKARERVLMDMAMRREIAG